MQTEPRLPEIDISTTQHAPAPVDVALDRLTLSGYRIDREKWEQLVQAGIVRPSATGDRAERATIGRLRKILEIERRLAPFIDIDALCFHLAVSGVKEIPAAAVGRHIAQSLGALFAIGDRIIEAIRPGRGIVGPDGEQRLGRSMARYALRSYAAGGRDDRDATEQLVAAAFVAYVRSTWSNPRPDRTLHRSSRLVNLEAEEQGTTRRTAEAPLPPLADRESIATWLAARIHNDPDSVIAAVRNSAALIRLYVTSFPELQLPWRDAAEAAGGAGVTALQTLAIVPPVLAIAFLQGGRATADPHLQRTLEHLMHFWGTLSVEAVRFDLANGAFPWVGRTSH
jgi:hypothetical protein